MRFYIIFLILMSVIINFLPGCGGGNGNNNQENTYFNRTLEVIPDYSAASPWETWIMGATLEGNNEKDYSFIARLVIKRDGEKIYGFGNADNYPLGNFVIIGTRKGDNIDFELLSQNRYRAFSLNGRGIYINAGSKIGGNRLEGSDFWTVFDDPIEYSGSFQVDVSALNPPEPSASYSGKLDGAYNSIENGSIRLMTNDDASALTIESFKGGFVGTDQTEGVFDVHNPSLFGDIPIDAFSFNKLAVVGEYTVQFDGAVSGSVASGYVIIQQAGKTYIGAFTTLAE